MESQLSEIKNQQNQKQPEIKLHLSSVSQANKKKLQNRFYFNLLAVFLSRQCKEDSQNNSPTETLFLSLYNSSTGSPSLPATGCLAPVDIQRYTTLHCTVFCCTALHCALHCTALHCTALHCTALHCTALHCTALHCTALHCTAMHCIALYCTTLCTIKLHYTTLYYTALKYTRKIMNE